MSIKLTKAFEITEEEHADAFERFANAFLIDDYPEIKPLGGKKDQGMDAYIYDDSSGDVVLVAQSCISPASTARTKVLATMTKLLAKNRIPRIFVYCTSANVGTQLDSTKLQLRQDHGITLEVMDAVWFVARCQSSQNRAAISEAYSRETLDPFISSLQPDKLYSLVLAENEQRIAIQYIEAVNLDRSKDGNLTKGIFEALIACVTQDSVPNVKAYSSDAIVTSISAMFPAGHASRIGEIVPGRITHLTNKRVIHLDKQAGGYVLSAEYKKKMDANIAKAQERELSFLTALGAAVKVASETLQVDYEYKIEDMVHIGHQTVLWYLREQGKRSGNGPEDLLNILNAEKLVSEFLKHYALHNDANRGTLNDDHLKDLLPQALFATLNSEDEDIRQYLRGKADLFIVHGFLQVTPDVQAACLKLLGGDILYLDTTVLIRCLAEYYSTGSRQPLLETLKGARGARYQLKTWTPYIGELVSHLRNRVLQEWANHYQNQDADKLTVLLRAARTLVRVFCEKAKTDGRSLPDIVEEILGKTNAQENAIEFLREEFGIITEDIPEFDEGGKMLHAEVYEVWANKKRRPENMPEEAFQRLIHNDVTSYVAIIRLRHTLDKTGPNYGHKIWYLSFDQMPWRVSWHLSHGTDSKFDVAMSLSYLMNCVATLAITGRSDIPANLIPATTILEEAELVSQEMRAIYERDVQVNERPFLQARRMRLLAHELKSSKPVVVEPLGADLDNEPAERDDV